MQYLKQQLTVFFSIFLCSVMGGLFILGQPAFAADLAPQTTYKVSRIGTNPTDECYGKTAYVKFHFESAPFSPNDPFDDIYPIEDGWELIFNTPITAGKGEFTALGLSQNGGNKYACGLQLIKSVPEKISSDSDKSFKLDLLSGFKSTQEARQDKTGHFVVAKDYYLYDPDNALTDIPQAYNDYDFLGSVTAIGGDNFPALNGAAVGELVIAPNSIRAPHWHLNYAEAGYCYSGLGQVGIIAPSFAIAGDEDFSDHPRIEEMFVKPGEVFIFPLGSQHYLRNIDPDEKFSCALFFAQDTPINPGQLLTITLQEVNKNTPLGTLQPVLSMDVDDNGTLKYTAEQLSQSPDQTYIPANQTGDNPMTVVEVCRGETPDISNPGCPSFNDKNKKGFDRSIFSRLQP